MRFGVATLTPRLRFSCNSHGVPPPPVLHSAALAAEVAGKAEQAPTAAAALADFGAATQSPEQLVKAGGAAKATEQQQKDAEKVGVGQVREGARSAGGQKAETAAADAPARM